MLEDHFPMHICHDLSGFRSFKFCFRSFTVKLDRRTRIQVLLILFNKYRLARALAASYDEPMTKSERCLVRGQVEK